MFLGISWVGINWASCSDCSSLLVFFTLPHGHFPLLLQFTDSGCYFQWKCLHLVVPNYFHNLDLTLSSHRDFVYVPFLQTPVLPKHRIVFSHHQSILRLSHVVLYHQFLIIDWAISLSMHTYPRAFLLLKNTNKNKLS